MACSCNGKATPPTNFNYFGGQYDYVGDFLNFPAPFGTSGSGIFSARDFIPGYGGQTDSWPANASLQDQWNAFVAGFEKWLSNLLGAPLLRAGPIDPNDGHTTYPQGRATTEHFN